MILDSEMTALDYFKQAKKIVALCGAGLSVDSGLRTFRDPDGYWNQVKPEDLATPEAFRKDSNQVWAWYRFRAAQARQASPNKGHEALSRLARIKHLTLITQNVDGLQQRSDESLGEPPVNMPPKPLELHGSLHRAHCTSCQKPYATQTLCAEQPTPLCTCGAKIRPSIIWFGESLDASILQEASQALQEADLFLSIGTSAQVWPAAAFIPQAAKLDCPVLEINPNATDMSRLASLCLKASASEALYPLILDLESHAS
jgi:NAD-dependent deacetylase